MAAVRLTKATRDDLPAVLALLRDCDLLEHGVGESLDRFLVARREGVVVGCAGLELGGRSGLLRSVAVRTAERGTGLGTELVTRAITVAKGERVSALFLLTTTAPAFFARLGFVPVPRAEVPPEIAGSWEFQTGCPQSAQVMRLELGRP